jgi:hypothetical protein
MNVFEDLIEELRDENLLEQTIIELIGHAPKPNGIDSSSDDRPALGEQSTARMNGSSTSEDDDESFSDSEDVDRVGADFYRKRAMDEVSSLQMVEHVLSGIEREYMRMVPETYDDLAVKKALHTFLQVDSDYGSTEYSEAEFQLMQETEVWSSALSERDRDISVANLRRFCENSRPVLSAQALLSLARFYRNAPYSEATRSKFDFVMTRLFARENDGAKRRLLFGRSEMIGHIKTLYANWSSVALYSTGDESPKVRSIIVGLEDRIAEAESALTFDQLIEDSFFKKVNEFKESTGEVFFTPEVVAATIDCNTKIGNKLLDLIRLERERTSAELVEQKYGAEYDHLISAAAGKTLHVVDVVHNLPENDPDFDEPRGDEEVATVRVPTRAREVEKTPRQPFLSFNLFGVNKWLLLVTVLIVTASAGLYLWADGPMADSGATEKARDVSFDGTPLKEYMRTGRATEETFYAITLPSWDQLTEAKKKEVLKQALEFATQNGQKRVQILNPQGRNAGFAAEGQTEVLSP